MARVWIEDLWLKDSETILPNGMTARVPVPASARKSLAAYMKLPEKARVPEEFRTERYGTGKRWRVYWWGVEPDGKRKRKSKAFAERADAESYAAAMEDDIRSGRYVNPDDGNRSFNEVAQAWLASKNNLRGSSYFRYEKEMRCYVLPKWGNRAISSIGEMDINEWVKELAEGRAPHEFVRKKVMKPLKAKSIKSIVMDTFGGAIGYAAAPRRRWIPNNPLESIKLPQDKTVDDRVFLDNQQVLDLANATAIVDKATPTVSRMLVLFLAYTGLRVNEAMALRVSDVNFDTLRISVTKTVTIDRQGRETEGKPKGGKSRTVPLPSFLVGDLKDLVICRDSDEYFFTAARGGMIHLHNWRTRVWYPAKEAAGYGDVSGLRIHSLRHTYASIAIAAGCDVKTLQSIMGHASATETLNTYAALWPDRLDEVTKNIEDNYAVWRAQSEDRQ